jgi:hypothetical protein
VRNSAGRLGPLIDIRPAGGYVIAPGSHIGRHAYDVADAAHPIPLPGWIASLLHDRPAPTTAASRLPVPGTQRANSYALIALREESAKVAAAHPGTRNGSRRAAGPDPRPAARR